MRSENIIRVGEDVTLVYKGVQLSCYELGIHWRSLDLVEVWRMVTRPAWLEGRDHSGSERERQRGLPAVGLWAWAQLGFEDWAEKECWG